MDNPNLRVLLVDDDEDDRQLLHSALSDAIDNIVIEEMTSGQALINWIDEQRKQVRYPEATPAAASMLTIILLDMHMPLLTGLETLKSMGDMSSFPYMPVVMLTTTVNEQIKQQAYGQGIHLYMVKPTAYRGFYRVVEAVKLCYRDAQRMRDLDLNYGL